MDVIMYLFLFFVVFFMTIFTFTAEKQINRVRCGISAFVLNIVFTVGWVSGIAGLIWHEGMDFFMHFGVPAIVISLIFAALCTAGTLRAAGKLREERAVQKESFAQE